MTNEKITYIIEELKKKEKETQEIIDSLKTKEISKIPGDIILSRENPVIYLRKIDGKEEDTYVKLWLESTYNDGSIGSTLAIMESPYAPLTGHRSDIADYNNASEEEKGKIIADLFKTTGYRIRDLEGKSGVYTIGDKPIFKIKSADSRNMQVGIDLGELVECLDKEGVKIGQNNVTKIRQYKDKEDFKYSKVA